MYNKGWGIMNVLLNLDWLELVLSSAGTPTLQDRDGFKFSNTFKPHETNGFTKCNVITFENQAFAKLYSCPSARLLYKERNTLVLQLENESLYRKGIVESQIHKFLDEYNLNLCGIKELHVALDGIGLIKRHNQFFNREDQRRKRNVKLSNFIDDKSKEITGVTLGSRKSDKFVAMYNKSKEIEFSRKMYIREYWKNNGLDTTKEIDRVELRLKRSELKGLELEFSKLADINYLASLFKAKTDGYLNFINQFDKSTMSLIDWDLFNLTEIKREKLVKYQRPTQAVKTTIKTLFLEHLSSKSEIAREMAECLAKKYALEVWYWSTQGRWLLEYPRYKD